MGLRTLLQQRYILLFYASVVVFVYLYPQALIPHQGFHYGALDARRVISLYRLVGLHMDIGDYERLLPFTDLPSAADSTGPEGGHVRSNVCIGLTI